MGWYDHLFLYPHRASERLTFFLGGVVSDGIWPALSAMSKLKSLNILSLSLFSSTAIFEFIDTLRVESQQKFLLSIMNQDVEQNISERDQALIRINLAARVNGQFDYLLFREDALDSESDSD